MTLSVIVPVYNAEKDLSRCLDSLVSQWPKERSDYEVICVNDGSKDGSAEILEDYQNRFPNTIRIITQENKGLPGARNAGMDHATGEIIAFCDSDDYLFPGAYFYLYEKFWDESLDTLRFSSVTLDQYVMKTWKEPISLTGKVIFEGSGIEAISRGNILPFVWSNFYRRSFLSSNHLQMPQVVMCEDMYFNIDVYFHANRVRVVDACVYRYTVSNSQITKKRDVKTMKKSVEGYLQFFDRVHHYLQVSPNAIEPIERIKRQQLFPCLSRALGASFDRKDYLETKHHLVELEMLPVRPSSLSSWFVNFAMYNYLTYRLTSCVYSNLFIPFILPRLRRN